MADLTHVEICAGAGGQALGLEEAGFTCLAAAEIDRDARDTLAANRPAWKVEGDIRDLDGGAWRGQVRLLAGGVPCPPFTAAGRQLGAADPRDLFREAVRLVAEAEPDAVMLENVRGLADPRFTEYRARILDRLRYLGYRTWWQMIRACDHGVPQLRPRFVLVAIRPPWADRFAWPAPAAGPAPTVGDTLYDLMASRGWPGAKAWRAGAQDVGPTIVGGSRLHGGGDLGPTRARAEWAELGVDGRGIADAPPGADFPAGGMPKLTLDMVRTIQAIPDDWGICGLKTSAYRQVGNALPPPMARALGSAIAAALNS